MKIQVYRHELISVPYSRIHVCIFLLTLCMLALGITGALFTCVYLFTQTFIPHILLAPCLPCSIWLIKTGRKHWYFEEIDAASNRMGNAYTFKLQQERSSIEDLLRRLRISELSPADRVSIRQELKALIMSLEAEEGLESVVPYWQAVPYLEPVRKEPQDWEENKAEAV